MFRAIRTRLALRQRGKANAAIRKLCEDVEYLGIGPVPGPVRVALRAHYETKWQTWAVLILIGYFVLKVVARALWVLVVTYTPAWVQEAIYGPPPKASLSSREGWVSFGHGVLLVGASFLAARRVAVWAADAFELRSMTFERVQRWADLISECAETVRAPHMRPDLQAVSLRFAVMRIRGARSMRGTVPALSRRRPGLRAHANGVVAALRAAHADFDLDRKEAARKLAALTLKVSDRYAQGHVGALLDSAELVEPARRREAFNLAVMAGVMVAVALGVHLWRVPMPLAVGVVVMVGAWLYRSTVSAGLAVLTTLLPVIFPGK
ncbi:hypothetical protein AB0L71_29280 [Streptomyces sp. NPDC052052]|uniref:hypothetical protein n=1 Tax=Streptomyces sp. NPDC052052 TaxID=3154756 RepID=UPI00342062AF